MKTTLLLIISSIFLTTSTHAEEGSAWIVAAFITDDGNSGEMAFNNPQYPDMTLEECKDSLGYALPMIKGHVEKIAKAEFKSAKCVWSSGDPIKPKK